MVYGVVMVWRWMGMGMVIGMGMGMGDDVISFKKKQE